MNTNDRAVAIVGRLNAEMARDLSDAELERCLLPCVMGRKLVPLAKQMRDAGELNCKCDPPPMPIMATCPACDKLRPHFNSF